MPTLTNQEKYVRRLKLAQKGLSPSEIARKEGLKSSSTIYYYLTNHPELHREWRKSVDEATDKNLQLPPVKDRWNDN